MPPQVDYEALLDLDPEYLQQEISRFEASILKLNESNDEMLHYHNEDPDPIYLSSIEENQGVIRDQQERINLMRRAIDEILGRQGASFSTQAHYGSTPAEVTRPSTSTTTLMARDLPPAPVVEPPSNHVNGIFGHSIDDHEDEDGGLHL